MTEAEIAVLFQEANDWAQNGDLSGAAFKASEAIDEFEKLTAPDHLEGRNR